MNKDIIRISEIFGPTIQGEGAVIGQPTVFVRTGGCDYRCSWCDTLHAVESKYRHDWKPMTAGEVFARVEELSGRQPILVTLSGGNPAIQNMAGLIAQGQEKGYRFALETQGSVVQDWFADLDVLTLSPKPPSSGEDTDFDKLVECVAAAGANTETTLKIVVADEADFEYARQVSGRYPKLPVYLQPVNHTPPPAGDEDAPIDLDGINERMDWLVGRVMAEKWYEAIVLPQLHVMLWGNKKGV